MKKSLLIKNMAVAMLLIGTFLLSACRRNYLDAQPDNLLTLDQIFSNRAQTEKWWAGLFSEVPQVWLSRFSLETDELDNSNWEARGDNNGIPQLLSNRRILTEKIRLASIFLERVDGNKEIKQLANGDQLIKQYKGEARFMRAYYYWYMMKYLGPVVIMPLNPSTPTDNFQIPRSSWDECVSFVLGELALAKEDLPLKYTLPDGGQDDTQMGRINKVIVTALESEILLFHASPLYNGNTEVSDFRNKDGKILISQTYDPQRWRKAADKALEAITLAHEAGKRLYQVGNPMTNFDDAVKSTRDLYWAGATTEGIWLRPASNNDNWEVYNAPRSVQGTGFNGLAVVQRLVDAYRMRNGDKIQESSLYNENTYTTVATNYYVAGTNTMYTNREARFYAHITFNGSITPGIPKAGENNRRVEFFRTGNSGKAGTPRDWPKTGYTVRKNLFSGYSRIPKITTIRPAMLIRLAGLYLNYAEALNEAEPGHADILEYLNRIRRRAGLPDLKPGLTQAQMREEIRLERRVELSFETYRYSDVRRWKVPDRPGSNQGGAFYGMNMDAGTSLSDPEFHKRVVAFTRAPFNRRYYFLPYGQDEMDRNLQLVEFPGY